MVIKNVKKTGLVFVFFSFFILMLPDAFSQTPVKRVDQKKATQPSSLKLSLSDYEDRVNAIWIGQMAAAIMGFRFEHHTASV